MNRLIKTEKGIGWVGNFNKHMLTNVWKNMKRIKFTPTQLFIFIVIVVGAIGVACSILGMVSSTISLLKENVLIGIFCIIFDLLIILFCVWAIIEGIVKPLEKYNESYY